MPSFRDKIDQKQARALVTQVRAFAPPKKTAPPQDNNQPAGTTAPSDRVEEHIRALQQELDELREQFRRLSNASSDSRRATIPMPNKPAAVRPAGPATADAPAARKLFAQHCRKCHGEDGTGSAARRQLAKIPNFTDAAWQARRSDAQLVASILDGKGGKMPPWRDKVSENQARGLVAYIRTFTPTTGSPPSTPQKPPASNGPEDEQNGQADHARQFSAQGCLHVAPCPACHTRHLGCEVE